MPMMGAVFIAGNGAFYISNSYEAWYATNRAKYGNQYSNFNVDASINNSIYANGGHVLPNSLAFNHIIKH